MSGGRESYGVTSFPCKSIKKFHWEPHKHLWMKCPLSLSLSCIIFPQPSLAPCGLESWKGRDQFICLLLSQELVSALRKGKGATFLPCQQCVLVTKPHKLQGWFWSKNHRILNFGRDLQAHSVPPSPSTTSITPRASSRLLLDNSRESDSKPPLSQGLTTLSKEKTLLISNLNLSWQN